ncbi:MAG: Hint domain-containing protein [Pseudomonadota bacterium]
MTYLFDPKSSVIWGRMYDDTNADNTEINDAGGFEPGIEGQLITLLDAHGNVKATTTTDANGEYQFTGLPAGTYTVQFPTAIGDKTLVEKDVGDFGTDSDGDQATGRTDEIHLGKDQTLGEIDAGYRAGQNLDGVVSGDETANLIDAAYMGDPEGDMIDAGDAIQPDAGPDDDVVDALGGNDTVLAGAGDDTIFGGAGNDSIDGGAGNDLIYGDSDLAGGSGGDSGEIAVDPVAGADQTLLVWELSDVSVVNAPGNDNPFPDNVSGEHDVVGSTLSFNSGAAPTAVGINDGDSRFNDGDGSQDLSQSVTLNGITGQAGDRLTPEYAYSLESSTGDLVNIYAVELGGNDPVGFVSDAPIDTSETYTFLGRTDTTPDVNYANLANVYLDGSATDTGDGDNGVAGDDTLLGGDGNDTIFGEGGNDSIEGGAGDDVLYGDGDGSLQGGNPVNLLVNGSFEDVTGLATDPFGFVGTGSIPGWTTADPNARIEVYNVNPELDPAASDGLNALDLEGSPGNIRIGQDVQNLVDGESYALRFDVTDSPNLTSIDGPEENVVDVFFGGELIATIDPSNIDEAEFETIQLTVEAGSGDGSDRLEFQGRGVEDSIGVGLDNVQLLALTPAGVPSELVTGEGDDTIDGGLGADTMYGEGGNDTFVISNPGEAGGDVVIGGNGPDETLDNDVLDLRGLGQVEIDDMEDPTDEGARMGTVTVVSTGETLTFSQIETILTDPQGDGVVDGAEAGEAMPVGYSDAQGDLITEGDDTIFGNGGDDTIDAGGGDDSVSGGDGDDLVDGGFGNDTISGDDGNDDLSGNFGDDQILGGAGNDQLDGGEGNDTLSGGLDDDILFGDAGNDSLSGDEGDDVILGGDGDDTLLGGEGADTLAGGEGADSLDGGDGDDDIAVGGEDTATGGAGDDVFTIDASDPATDIDVTIDGGSDGTDGNPAGPENGDEGDVLDLGDQSAPLEVVFGTDPESGTVDGLDADDTPDVTFEEIEKVLTGSGDDTIDGSNATGPLDVDAGAGDDVVDGGDGDDRLVGGDGDDSLSGGAGNDTLEGGAGSDTLEGGEGADVLEGGDNDDTFVLGVGDVASGGDGDDVFTVDPSLTEGSGPITVTGGEADEGGADTTNDNYPGSGLPNGDILDLRGLEITDFSPTGGDPASESGSITYLDDNGDPVTVNYTEIEAVLFDPMADGVVDGEETGEDMGVGYDDSNPPTDGGGDMITDGDDVIEGNGGDDTIDGGAGDDLIDGGADDDVIEGGDGDDTLLGGDGSDTLAGGEGADELDGGDGDDDIAVGGEDTATGGAGDDVFTIDPTDPATDIDVTIDGGSDGTDGNPAGPENGDEGDVLDLGDQSAPLEVVFGTDPESGTVDGLDADDTPDVTFEEIEKVLTGSGDDTIDGSNATGPIDVDTGAGDDSVVGGEGDDVISTGPGNDTVISGDGSDTVDGGDGDNFIDTSSTAPVPLPDDGFPGYGPVPAIPADGDPDDDRDFVTAGSGNDTIITGDDNDTIDAGDGDNLIDAGIDDDDITTGDGNDTIVGGEGNDTITSGGGDDLIYGGLDPAVVPIDGTDIPDAPDGGSFGPDPDEDNGRDLIFAGAGNDTVFGQDDDDTIYGGDGDDSLDGGVDDDLIFGESGDDTIIGGQGADTLSGGAGSDVFVIENREDAFGDEIDGGTEDGDGDPTTDNEFDELDLRGLGRFEIVQSDGTTPLDLTTPNDPDGNSYSGQVNFLDASGNVEGVLTFTEIENIVPCFTPGTVIATPKGERLVEDLKVGDRIITRDNGIQEIRWLGRRDLKGRELLQAPHLKPVLVRAGSLGNGLPERDMVVSPNHRVLINNDRTALYFEEREVLAAAKHLTGLEGVDAVEASGVSYIHFMFDNHEVVLSNGAWTESFQPGEQTMDGMGQPQRDEIFELFPELREAEGLNAYQSARRSLKKHEARLLVK